MQLGRSRLAEPAQQQWSRMRLCYNCGASGHLSPRCPERPSLAQVVGGSRFFSLLVPVLLCVSNPGVSVSALIDSGAAVNLIDGALVEKLGIPTFPCLPPLRITAIDSCPIGVMTPKFPGARGSWYAGHPPARRSACGTSEERAARLPAHQPWDCAIDLLPNASPPRGRVYPLSLPESKAMEEYIETALAAGHIRPSTSPAAAGFFFVGKKDGGLCPCIDYRGLNAITVPYPYPLPLVPAVLEQLRGARIFSKLDLRSAYSLVRIKKEGRFIRNYSSVAGPLTSLLRGKPKKLTWTDQARAAFQQLKDCFTSAPILRHPDPDLPFVVEVDASSSGLGAVLCQRHGEPGKLYPCTFYSRKLTTAEANYDVGNRELLAIKAALEEWRHWLEGARHPFQVLTDHRNLEYLHGAKRLNPRQARWALFFTRFQFMVTYRPGSKNGKAKYSVTELRQRRKCSDPFAELAIGDEQRLSRKQAQSSAT
ncbi:hypothetical protein QTP70_031361, partial [Hemibagrus guttatus]